MDQLNAKLKNDKEVLYDLISEKVAVPKVPKDDFFKLLDFLDESLNYKNSEDGKVSAREQRLYIGEWLNSMELYEAIDMAMAWGNLSAVVGATSWYDKMHSDEGGIVNSGDDGFYMDFKAWLASRGTKFLIKYFELGADFVISYITDNNIPRSEYLYENISYEFSDYSHTGVVTGYVQL